MKFAARCVLFDLDGTLVDTAPDLGHAANCVRADLGLAPLPLADYRSAASGGARGLLGVALGIGPQDPRFLQLRTDFLAHYEANICRGSVLFDGMAALLQGIEAAGLRWGVVTNKARAYSVPLMAALGLDARSACLVSGDDVPYPKPAPDSLRLACLHMGLTVHDAVYVGDDLRDITAGNAAGMPTVAAGWGYLGEHPDLRTWQASVIVQTPGEILPLLG